MAHMILDRSGELSPAQGYILVEDEVTFLQLATDPGALLHVRKQHICGWAELFCMVRSIPCEDRQAPSEELLTVCPELTRDQARDLLKNIGSQWVTLKHPISIVEIVQSIYPNRLWARSASITHAAEVLVWLAESSRIIDSTIPLLHRMNQLWQSQVPYEQQFLYSAEDKTSATELIENWLGINPDPRFVSVGEFPISIEPRFERKFRDAWVNNLVNENGLCVFRLLAMPSPQKLREIAAEASVKYFMDHRDKLTQDHVKILSQLLTQRSIEQLTDLIPPLLPGLVPESIEDVIHWFKFEYLPYRKWMRRVKSSEVADSINEAVLSFSKWYLVQYPKALLRSGLYKYLSFAKVVNIAQRHSDFVTLLVLMDGLHLADASFVLDELGRRVPRLICISEEIAFAALPTITEFCKASMLYGRQPSFIEPDSETIGEVIQDRQSPNEALSRATPGKLVIWRIAEPDDSYHKRNSDSYLKNTIEAVLSSVVQKIGDVTDSVDSELPLRVIIGTDHGRLMTFSKRTVHIPKGMQAHGRAAWGTVNRNYPENGFIIEGNAVHLSPSRFGLREDTTILLDENSYLTNDGRTGGEYNPHGGIYPEEVMIPWFILERDACQPDVGIELSGIGTAGASSTLKIKFSNYGTFPVHLERIISRGSSTPDFDIELKHTISGQSIDEITCSISQWPDKKQILQLDVKAIVRWGGKRNFEVPCSSANMLSLQMYDQSDILGDLPE